MTRSASFGFDDEQKSNWTNVLASDEERNGVPFGDMPEEQQQAVMAILESAMSEESYEKAVGIMEGDEVLAGEGGGEQFGIDHFVAGIFGTPSKTDPCELEITQQERDELQHSIHGDYAVSPDATTVENGTDGTSADAQVSGSGSCRSLAPSSSPY